MSDIGNYTFAKHLHEARIAEAQRSTVARDLNRRVRRKSRDNARRALAGVLHRLANRIEPARSFRIPAQRHTA